MGVLGDVELREKLMRSNDEYRRLAVQHQSYDQELEKLNSLQYPNEEERIREINLKKKKLLLKDQMYSILQKYRRELEAGS